MGLEFPPADPLRWGLARRIAFRFVFVYLVLYNLPFPIGALPISPSAVTRFAYQWAVKPYQDTCDVVVLWAGKRVFDLDITVRPAGSGDTTWNYVEVFCFAVLSAT